MNIRPMRIADYDAVYALWENTEGMGLSDADSRGSISRFLQRNDGFCFVAEYEGALVGTVMCGHDGRRGYLYHAAVREDLRGQGIGKALIDTALGALAAAGIQKGHAFVFASNETGQAFWTAAGWHGREDIALFSKNL